MADVFAQVLSLSLSGTLVALAVFALCGLSRRRFSKTWRYYVWLIVLARLVLPFAPQGNNLIDLVFQPRAEALTRQVQTVQAHEAGISHEIPLWRDIFEFAPRDDATARDVPYDLSGFTGIDSGAVSRTPDAAEPQEETPPEGRAFRGIMAELWQYAWVVWLGVALMLLVRMVTSYHSFTRFIRAGWKPVDDPIFHDTLDEVSRVYGIKKPLPLYHNPLANSPMLVGIVRPVIVLPTLRMEPETLRHILAHELVHHKRRDILYKWLVQVITCLHWFNPMVYLVKRDIHIACELSCDKRVLHRMESENYRQYGDTLLSVVQTSGQYGDVVASVTMSEEGKIVQKRLQSIAHPNKQSKLTVMLSVIVSILLLFGAAYAGAYTGMPGTTEAANAPAPTDSQATQEPTEPAEDPTKKPTPGERLDSFLGDMETLKNDLGDRAHEWGGMVADKAAEWGKSLENWANSLDWEDWYYWAPWNWQEDWEASLDNDEHMFINYYTDNRTIISGGFYGGGYILQLKYDSAAELDESDLTVLEGPAIAVSRELSRYAEDETILALMESAQDQFVKKHGQSMPDIQNGFLRLVCVDGPYDETPDALLSRFYHTDDFSRMVAVFNSGLISQQERLALMKEAVRDSKVACLAVLLDDGIPDANADELLLAAYENDDIASFSILADSASPEGKQRVKSMAVKDGNVSFAAMVDGKPDEASVNEMLDIMLEDGLDVSMIAIIHDQLTAEQALRIATAAYEQDDIASFSVVMDCLSDEEVAAFHERAHKDERTAFYSVTSR